MNTQPTIREFLLPAIRDLELAGVEEARRNVEWMLESVLGCNRAILYAYPERELTRVQLEKLRSMLARRQRREPIQYILGYSEFFGLRLRVTRDVLIPRPETEQVVEEVLHLIGPETAPRILDVGTGSGCIALAIKNDRQDALVFACDVSEAALAVAESNATRLGIDIHLLHADVLRNECQAFVPGDLSLIVSNPPYIPDEERESLAPEVASYEPGKALFCGNDPLRFYRAIIRHTRPLLRPGGWIVFEAHESHAEEVGTILDQDRFVAVSVKRDLAERPRIVQAQRPV